MSDWIDAAAHWALLAVLLALFGVTAWYQMTNQDGKP